MEATGLLHGVQVDLIAGEAYKVAIEASVVTLLCFIGVTDFRSFKIHNGSVLLLLALYALYAILDRSFYEILTDILVGSILFAVLLWLYSRGVVGGGDVKLVPVVCLWIGTHGALLFSLLLLLFVILHLVVVKAGWAPADTSGSHRTIPYAPSLAAALIAVIVLGYL
jgi:Flp pilus assembly protein protease CpaA